MLLIILYKCRSTDEANISYDMLQKQAHKLILFSEELVVVDESTFLEVVVLSLSLPQLSLDFFPLFGHELNNLGIMGDFHSIFDFIKIIVVVDKIRIYSGFRSSYVIVVVSVVVNQRLAKADNGLVVVVELIFSFEKIENVDLEAKFNNFAHFFFDDFSAAAVLVVVVHYDNGWNVFIIFIDVTAVQDFVF